MTFKPWENISGKEGGVMDVNNDNKPKKRGNSYTALGIVFGTSIGVLAGIVITSNLMWLALGMCGGVIVGAILDGYANSKDKG